MERNNVHRFFFIFLQQARNILFFDDDVEDEENQSFVLEKVYNFAEFTVPYMNDKQFQRHFRVTPDTFENIVQYIHSEYISNNIQLGSTRTVLEKELMVTLWCLSNMESFRAVADRFGISKSTCWSILYRTCLSFLKINKRYKIIVWPTREKQRQISQQMNANGLNGIIGCIDGSHIPIPAPKVNHISFINRKNFHSLLLQGVCDDQMLFTDVYTGEVSSLHDYTMYKRSKLYQAIRSGQIQFYDDTYLIGDLAYKLDINLMVGFKNNGHLTLRQKNFNYILSKKRVTIERAFALLKGRFRRLKMLETQRIDLSVLLIMSACILHNICLLNEDLPDDVNMEEEIQQERANNPYNQLDIDPEQEMNDAIQKRNGIVNALPIIVRDM